MSLWVVDPENPENDYLLDYSDSSNDNLEHIYCRADANYTDYEIAVLYSNIDDPNQPVINERYGLAWNITEKQDSDNIFLYDLNADGIVGEPDFKILLDNLLINSGKGPETSYLFGDINANGSIDVNDVETILYHKDQKADWLQENTSQ